MPSLLKSDGFAAHEAFAGPPSAYSQTLLAGSSFVQGLSSFQDLSPSDLSLEGGSSFVIGYASILMQPYLRQLPFQQEPLYQGPIPFCANFVLLPSFVNVGFGLITSLGINHVFLSSFPVGLVSDGSIVFLLILIVHFNTLAIFHTSYV